MRKVRGGRGEEEGQKSEGVKEEEEEGGGINGIQLDGAPRPPDCSKMRAMPDSRTKRKEREKSIQCN